MKVKKYNVLFKGLSEAKINRYSLVIYNLEFKNNVLFKGLSETKINKVR